MSSLLTLAKDLEQKSKAQQQLTGEMLKAAFSEHELSVRAELNASAERISAAISGHEQSMSEAMEKSRRSVLLTAGRSWLTVLMVSALLIATSGSVLWWQGQKIVSNMDTLSRQADALAKMDAKTWGVGYLQDGTGQYLVLPPGVKAEPGWTVENGKRNAVKLIREQK